MFHRIWLAVSIILLALFPAVAFAGDFRNQQRVTIGKDETVNDDLYSAGESLTIDGTVNGDVLVASGRVQVNGTVNGNLLATGGQIDVNGMVTGDVFAAGGQITIKGTVTDDLRVAGGDVTIDGKVGDDLLIGAGQVTVNKDAVVMGDVRAGTGNLTIAGTTGSIKASTDKLTLESTAKVNGDVSYKSSQDAVVTSGATITGKIVHEPQARSGYSRAWQFGGIIPLFSVLLAILFVYLFPNKSAAVVQDFRKRFGGNLLWGFLFLMVVPLAALILLISVIGSPLGLAALLLYPLFLFVGYLVGAIATGTWIKNYWDKSKQPQPTWLTAVIGVIVLALLGLIPFVGWLAGCLIFLAGLGALTRYDWDVVQQLRAKKTL